MDARKNFAFGTLAAGINNVATSLSVGAGEGARFPATPFNAVIWQATDYKSPAHAFHAGQAEIVRVTAIATDTLTITRAQEGTTAVNLNAGGKTYEIWAGPTDAYWTQLYAPGDILTTRGDLVVRGASIPQRLALGARGQWLLSDGTDAGWDLSLVELFRKRHVGLAHALGNGGMVGIGFTISNSGTGSNITPTSTDLNHTNYVSAATLNSLAGFSTTANAPYHAARRIRFAAVIRLVDLSVLRIVAGLGSSTGGNVAGADNPNYNLADFRFSTAAGDTNWQCRTKDGTTANLTDSGVAPSTSGPTYLEIDYTPGVSAKFWINGTLVATKTTNLPDGTTVMYPYVMLITLEAVAKNIRLSQIYVEETNP